MGWRGTLRTIVAVSRQVERDAIRRQRAIERQEKLTAKQRELDMAALAVQKYENHIELLQSTHKDCTPAIDWLQIKQTPEPIEAPDDHAKEVAARHALESYKPTFLQKLFKKEERIRIKLEIALEEAIKADQKLNTDKKEDFSKKVEDWKDSMEMATRVLDKDSAAYKEALEELSPFKQIGMIGSYVMLDPIEQDRITATVSGHREEDVVPKQQMSLLKSGKLSVRDLPDSRFNEIYQDHICSAALRIGRELFAILPISDVLVNVKANMLDSATGQTRDTLILSILLKRDTMVKLNYETLDPSTSMENFLCNMDFKKNRGFAEVEPVALPGVLP